MASDRAKRQMAAWERQGRTEEIIYRPGKSGLRPREITVVVKREASEPVMQGQTHPLRVKALNDELEGIPADPKLSDAGTDRVDVAERLGGPRVSRGLQRFAEQDADFVTMEVI